MRKGISLVALVVTIIVLIILTGAVILSFQDGGIIDRADQAVKDSNDAVLEEKITMMNLQYTQKLKKKFTPETRATLKAIVQQSGIDLDKLLVYYDVADGEQYVFYKIDKVNKKDVEWFIKNKVEIEGETEPKTIYFLIGDINLDGEVNEKDADIISWYEASRFEKVQELKMEEGSETPYTYMIGDLNGDYVLDSNDSSFIRQTSVGKIYDELLNNEYIDFTVKEEQIKTYFGIE